MNPRDLKAMFEQMKGERDSKWLDGYTAGLRRAQELAKEHAYLRCDGGKCGECAPDSCVMFDDFDDAIDAEAAKERT